MIRSIATCTIRSIKTFQLSHRVVPLIHHSKYNLGTLTYNKKIAYHFSELPKHDVLTVKMSLLM